MVGAWRHLVKDGKDFLRKKALRDYLEQFVDCDGYLNFGLVKEWEIEEIGVGIRKPEEFFHMWEHLRGQLWEKTNEA
jgi:hypothetical protein